MKESSFLPRRLRLAREARGLNASELAEAIGVSRQNVSGWEAGEYAPKPEALRSISMKLGFPERFFFRPCPTAEEGPPFFRKLSAVTARGRNQAAAKLNLLVEFAEYLLDEVELPEPAVPNFDIGTNPGSIADEDIEEIAAKTRGVFKIGNGPISNITRLLENNGIIVSRFWMQTEGLDAFSRWVNGIPYILNNSNRASGVCRTRFNLAHELGHLVMHRSLQPGQKNLKHIEAQANRFASAFLMPAETYLKDFTYPSLDVFVALKPKWLVSAAAQIVRCRDLSIILDGVFARLFANLNRRGWRTIEPLDNDLPSENPALLEKAILLLENEASLPRQELLNNFILSFSDVEDFAGLPSNFFGSDEQEPTLVIKQRPKVVAFPGRRNQLACDCAFEK